METTPAKKQAAYVLPLDLIRRIKVEASSRDSHPCKVVEAACSEYLKDRPRRRGKAASA